MSNKLLDKIKEMGIGLSIMYIGSPIYVIFAIDIFTKGFANFHHYNYDLFFPIWASIPIVISFVVGFSMLFTTSNEITNEIEETQDE